METPPKLPQDVQDKILEQLRDSASTLATCALVCRRWLHQSRHCLLSESRIDLDATVYEERDQLFQKLLFENSGKCSFWPHILDLEISDDYGTEETSEACIRLISSALPLASNLQTLRINRVWFSSLPEKAITAISSHSTISSLHLASTKFASPAQLLTLLSSLKSLSNKCTLRVVTFVEREWDSAATKFSPLPSLQFHVQVGNALALEDIAPVILHHAWNITSFNSEDLFLDIIDTDQFGQVLKHIGPSLAELTIRLGKHDEPCPISFEFNTSLKKLSVGRIVEFSKAAESWPSTKLTSALSTIQSREKFERLEGYIDYYALPGQEDDEADNGAGVEMWGIDSDDEEVASDKDEDAEGNGEEENEDEEKGDGAEETNEGDGGATQDKQNDAQKTDEVDDAPAAEDEAGDDDAGNDDDSDKGFLDSDEEREGDELDRLMDGTVADYMFRLAAVEAFVWQPVEEILLDKERFPGKGPTFALALTSELYDDQVTELVQTMCMPRLAQAESLTFESF